MSDPSIYNDMGKDMEEDIKNSAMHKFLNIGSSLVIFIPLLILAII